MSPLHVAATSGDLELLEVKLRAQDMQQINLPNCEWRDWTPLHYAAQNSKYDTARLLIENGAKTDIQAQNGCCAYEMAKEDEMRALCGGPTLAMHRAHKPASGCGAGWQKVLLAVLFLCGPVHTVIHLAVMEIFCFFSNIIS